MASINGFNVSQKNKHKSKKSLKRKRDKAYAKLNGKVSKTFTKITPTKSEWKKEPIEESQLPIDDNFDEPDLDIHNESDAVSNKSGEIFFSSDEDDTETSKHNSILELFLDENCSNIEAEVVWPKIKIAKKKPKFKKLKVENQIEQIEPQIEDEIIYEPQPEEPVLKDISKLPEPITSTVPKSTAQFCYTDDGTVVILEEDDTVYFHGLLILTVLHGEIEVFGYNITKDSPPFKLYSPRGTSLLYIKNKTKSNLDVSHFLKNSPVLGQASFPQNCAIVLCKKLVDNVLFVEKHISQLIFPKNDKTSFPRATFNIGENYTNVSEVWDSILEKTEPQTKLLICGGKGVGKSTLLRYSLNKLLTRFEKVRVVDLDPGQPEFTVPGCVSIITLDEPVFGVNYTHLKPPEKSILCNISVNYEPEKYIQCVKTLLEDKLSDIPTLVNYMGFTHGFGINILASVITIVRPTDVIQITSQDNKKNFKQDITPKIIKEFANLFEPAPAHNVKYNFHKINSHSVKNDGWTVQSRQLREMCVLAYFSKVTAANSIFHKDIPMYKIALNDITICDLNGKKIHPAAVNANIVSLCAPDIKYPQIFHCFGWGIVRGIDMAAQNLVLLTVEELDILEKVTHLVLGSISLPPSIYMTPDEISGKMPYVMEGGLISFGQIPKRSMISAKTQRNINGNE